MNAEKLTNYLNSVVQNGIPSVDCMVYKNHECIYRYMTGYTDHNQTVEVSNSTQYIMFSMTKVQTMVALMQLVEQGKISLEDPVGKYLPAYNNLSVVDADDNISPANPILIKHLASMQSGLDYDLDRPGIKRILERDGMKATTIDLVNAFVESPLNFQPGTRFCYSLSHDVVAAVIEVVSDMSFGEYLKKNIWEPLHMTRTHFAKPYNTESGLSDQFEMQGDPQVRFPMDPTCNYQLSESYESGGAGLISCTEDYAVFADTIACGGISKDGVRIIKPESIETIKENQLFGASLEDIINNMGRKGYGYGIGMQVLLHPEEIGSPAPAGVFGWDGAAGSMITMDTNSKLSVVYTMHVRNCGYAYGEVHPTLRDIVFGQE